MSQTLTQKTLHGIKWSYISSITTALMQIGYTAVMARLLNPADFGLVAMSGVILRFGGYFAQMGMGSAIIQKKDLTKEQISAVFTSSIFLGIFFSLLTYLLAPLARFIFDNYELIPVVKVMSLSFLINGLSLTSLALIQRKLKFKELAVVEIISFFVGYVIIGIGSALTGFGVWSLVFASLAQSILMTAMTFFIIKHEVSLSFSWRHYKPLFSFGSKVSIISFLEFIGSSLDTIFIGRLFGSSPLGIYNRAQMLVNLPMQYFASSFSRVLFPSFSRIQDDNERVKSNMFFILKIVSIIIFPFAIVIAILSKEIVEILLGPKWLEAALLLKFLSFAAAVNFLTHFIAVLFEAKGLLIKKIIIQSSFIVLLIILFYCTLKFGLLGFTLALLISQIFRFLYYFVFFLKEIKVNIFNILKDFFSPAFTSFVVFIITFVSYQFILTYYLQNYITIFLILFLFIIVYTLTLYSKINIQIKDEFIKRIKSLNTNN